MKIHDFRLIFQHPGRWAIFSQKIDGFKGGLAQIMEQAGPKENEVKHTSENSKI